MCQNFGARFLRAVGLFRRFGSTVWVAVWVRSSDLLGRVGEPDGGAGSRPAGLFAVDLGVHPRRLGNNRRKEALNYRFLVVGFPGLFKFHDFWCNGQGFRLRCSAIVLFVTGSGASNCMVA